MAAPPRAGATTVFTRRSRLPAPVGEAFDWHARPGAFERLAPPWDPVEIVGEHGGLAPGSRTELRMRAGPFPVRWIAEHVELEPGRSFTDVQRRGPFSEWRHTHHFEPLGPEASMLEDRVLYRLPGGELVHRLAGRVVRDKLERVFSYRHRVLARDLRRHAERGGTKTMRILISGASGLLGSSLSAFLTTGGHEVVRLVRRPARDATEVSWSPDTGPADPSALEGFDAVVHLAGENIAGRRWSAEQKARIRDSRVEGTRRLAEAVAGLEAKPRVFVSASAVGYYGDRGDEALHECSEPGSGFLAEVCQEWERASQPAEAAGIRVVRLRFGAILSPAGGALAKMLTPFKLGVGGRLGDGTQRMSWITIDDAVGVVHHALATDDLHGAVNATAPESVTNAEFTRTLGKVLGRPTVFPMPAPVARLAFGELADELLLASQRAEPRRLEDTGFRFDEPELEGALRHVLGRTDGRS